MHETVQVDLDALSHLLENCRKLQGSMEEGLGDISAYIDGVGADRVEDALNGFNRHWKDGRAHVKRHLDGIVNRLDAAVKQYEKTEGDLIAEMKKGG